MILDAFTKTVCHDQCFKIYQEAFTGLECAPKHVFDLEYYQGTVFARFIGNQVDGFAIVARRMGVPYIWAIAVREEMRGKGIGGDILDRIGDWAKQNREDAVELTVKTDNPAQLLYFRKGWRVVNYIGGFYGDAGDGLLMRRMI
jgi:ribosomal protein S18 acetylase RimI-like enzyme